MSEAYDPLSPGAAPGINLVISLRIYDVLMAILGELNEDARTALNQAHSEGLLLGSVPAYLGRFLTDEANP